MSKTNFVFPKNQPSRQRKGNKPYLNNSLKVDGFSRREVFRPTASMLTIAKSKLVMILECFLMFELCIQGPKL
jgi:hypothetical protein